MRPLKPAEMQEANLTSMVLFMKRVDIAGLGRCDFMNRPGSFTLRFSSYFCHFFLPWHPGARGTCQCKPASVSMGFGQC